ncbi:MAG: hypothetical protein ABL921_18935 [Pirellula sp.]
MQVTAISVRSSRTLPHPKFQFSNFKAEVELHAELADGDDANKCVVQLQGQAESLVEQHCHELRESIGEFHRVVEQRAIVPALESKIKQLSTELERVKTLDLPLFTRQAYD